VDQDKTMPSIRQAKVGEMIKRELAEILQREMRDPRLALVTVTDVEVARDFTSAKVFVSVIGDERDKADGLKALQGASGFLRGQLGRHIDLRTVPTLLFRYDTGIERGVRMFELLRQEEAELAGDGGKTRESDGTKEDEANGDSPGAGADGERPGRDS
jgi:ribosome-binding factor A